MTLDMWWCNVMIHFTMTQYSSQWHMWIWRHAWQNHVTLVTITIVFHLSQSCPTCHNRVTIVTIVTKLSQSRHTCHNHVTLVTIMSHNHAIYITMTSFISQWRQTVWKFAVCGFQDDAKKSRNSFQALNTCPDPGMQLFRILKLLRRGDPDDPCLLYTSPSPRD